MLGDGALSFREFVMREPLPLATIHEAVLDFLRGRDDIALFGAHAVNAYVDEPRMTQDVHLLSTRAPELSEELRDHLATRFGVAIRVRHLATDRGYRLYQVRKPRNRHLVDVRPVASLPPTRRMAEVPVVDPVPLIAAKVISFVRRRGTPKSGTDWHDIAMLLLAFPDLKRDTGPIRDRLDEEGAGGEILAAWRDFVAREIIPEDEDAP